MSNMRTLASCGSKRSDLVLSFCRSVLVLSFCPRSVLNCVCPPHNDDRKRMHTNPLLARQAAGNQDQGNNDEIVRGLCYIFSEMAESYLTLLEQGTPDTLSFVELICLCAANPGQMRCDGVYCSFFCARISSFPRFFIHAFIHSFIHSFVHSFIHSFEQSFVPPSIFHFTHSFPAI